MYSVNLICKYNVWYAIRFKIKNLYKINQKLIKLTIKAEKTYNFASIFISAQNFSHPRDIANQFVNFWSSVNSDKAF